MGQVKRNFCIYSHFMTMKSLFNKKRAGKFSQEQAATAIASLERILLGKEKVAKAIGEKLHEQFVAHFHGKEHLSFSEFISFIMTLDAISPVIKLIKVFIKLFS